MYQSIGLTKQLIDSITCCKTSSYANAPVSSKKEKFPLLVFSSGYYFGISDIYTNIMETLASNGYIVISLMHPFDQGMIVWKDGKILKLRKKHALLAFLQLYITEKTEFRNITNTSKKDKIIKRYLRRLKRFNKALNVWTEDTKFCINSLKITRNKLDHDWLIKKNGF